jgi:uncharacterized membrane protein YeaQ/YmgE (transglycosylase-associated protein family)
VTLSLLLAWLAVGIVTGWLTSITVAGGYGLAGDVCIGIAGASMGSFLFRKLELGVPFSGIAGTIFIAFTGAVVLLLPLHLLTRRRRPKKERDVMADSSNLDQRD